MKDDELCLLFREALNSTLLILKSLVDEGQHMTSYPIEEPEFLSDGSTKIRLVFKPLVLSLPVVHQRLSNVGQVSKLCEFIAGSDFSKQLVAKQAATPADEQVFDRLFLPFLKHYLSEVAGLGFDQNAFQRVYEGIMAYFSLPTITLLFTAPLLGFDMKSNEDSIELAPGVFIRHSSSEVKKQLWRDASISSSWSREDATSLEYQAEFKEQVPKESLFSYRTYPEYIENLQHLLRLVKREAISIMCVFLSSSPWYLGPGTVGLPRYLPWATTKPLIGRYISFEDFSQGQIMAPPFSPDEVENLKSLWTNLSTMKNDSRFILALRRFSSYHEKLTHADKLIDLWVGLELLFPDVIGASRGASQRRLREITNFLSVNLTDRRRINRDLKNSYELRSDIVHGLLPYRHNAVEYTPKTEEIFAKCLLKCLTQQSLPQP